METKVDFLQLFLVTHIGTAAAPLWSSKCAYLTTVGIQYAELNDETQDAVVTRFFGIFFLIFQSGQIWGNLISSMVLGQGKAEPLYRYVYGEF